MTKLEELDLIANRIVEVGGELPTSIEIGYGAFSDLMKELHENRRQLSPDYLSRGSFMTISVFLSVGQVNIRPAKLLPPDFFGIGRITLNDILIEDILLDGEIHSDLDSSI